MKQVILLLFLSVVCSSQYSLAQQIPLLTQYGSAHGILNPASIRTDFHLSLGEFSTFIGGTHRMHWQALSKNNSTQIIHGEKLLINSGVAFQVGGHIINDRNGPISTTGIYGKIAGIINDDLEWGGLSFGVNFGLVQYRMNLLETNGRETNDPLVNENITNIRPDISLGAYFYKTSENENIFYIGLSLPQLFKFDDQQKASLVYLKKNTHIHLSSGYIITGNDDYSYLEISSQLLYVKNVSPYFSAQLKYQFENIFWLGLGYSMDGTFLPQGGILLGNIKQLKLGFNSGLAINSFGPKFGNSYEFTLLYAF